VAVTLHVLGLCSGVCLLDRLELVTFYAEKFRLYYRMASASDGWLPVERFREWVVLPSGLGHTLTIEVSPEERVRMGPVSALRLELTNENGMKRTSFCCVNVFGWYDTNKHET